MVNIFRLNKIVIDYSSDKPIVIDLPALPIDSYKVKSIIASTIMNLLIKRIVLHSEPLPEGASLIVEVPSNVYYPYPHIPNTNFDFFYDKLGSFVAVHRYNPDDDIYLATVDYTQTDTKIIVYEPEIDPKIMFYRYK